MSKKIIAFGELLWDILPDSTILGGAPFNFAYRVNTLGDQGLMVSRLGRDALGRQAYDKMAALELDTQYLQWDEQKPTGTVQVSFDANNSPDYVIIPDVAYDFIELHDHLLQSVLDVDCLCFGTLIQRNNTARETLAQLLEHSPNSLKILDINLRRKCYSPETITFSLQHADILKLNETETHQLRDMLEINDVTIPGFCQRIIEKYSLQYCLITLEERGAFAVSLEGEKVYVPGFQIDLADSLGAGDAFNAGFVHKILRGESLQTACAYGNIIGAIVATQIGATVPIVSGDVESFAMRNTNRNIDDNLEAFIAV